MTARGSLSLLSTVLLTAPNHKTLEEKKYAMFTKEMGNYATLLDPKLLQEPSSLFPGHAALSSSTHRSEQFGP